MTSTTQPKDLATSFLHIRALPQDKSAWVRTANRRGKKLSVHVTDTLNAESAKDTCPHGIEYDNCDECRTPRHG